MRLGGRLGRLQWLISSSLIVSGAMLALGLAVQGFLSQELIEAPIWKQLLTLSTQSIAHLPVAELQSALPTDGPVQGWLVSDPARLPAGMPAFFAALAPGYYGEGDLEAARDPPF
ncbi:hypothetical protein ABQZ99_010385 [Xanthomonas hortorum pv. vitians]|uniref:hypothetical protein n=1 Tax=Xanthomonas hortorum TaxID=56454 RepID=UPI001CD9A7B3|nr:hypothetical protein [Xanthomonas hortorum]MCE4281652.1 hypothetical protein [Xanthomonas hortorum pv. vitians]MCE4286486.1 hypothetical protein [Xanthomonas hortorum pv. vitians]MCE4291076.1 hypothetical protein [Xanthomonas hortorum pv. vitians]MCE4295224.1 hypothetical protein [Xanthomonas hortorum pv. vitians]MCE4517219.1 hypothetical protein [Xanthomonas hortorum pv. vitians]